MFDGLRGAVSACTIRPYQQGDAEHLHAAALESVAEISPWLGWCHSRYSLDEAQEWVAAQQDLAKQRLAFAFAIWSEGRYLGGCGINQINGPNRYVRAFYAAASTCPAGPQTPSCSAC